MVGFPYKLVWADFENLGSIRVFGVRNRKLLFFFNTLDTLFPLKVRNNDFKF